MIVEQIVVGRGSKYPLDGLLTLPAESSGPVPAVVFVHGSGASNMDERIGNLTPFKDLAEGLAKHGIASIRYDKRTFAHKNLIMNEKDVTVRMETIADALLATKLLRKDSRIDSKRIFIVGHSMGAMLAPRIHAEGGNYHGFILLAGSPRKLEEIIIDQQEEALKHTNVIQRMYAKKQVKKLSDAFATLYDLSDKDAKKKDFGNGVSMYYFKEMGRHAVADYLNDCYVPMLIMQGEKDFQTSVEKDFNAYKELLQDRDNVTFRLYENLNHAFVPSVYGNIMKAKQEYEKEQHIGENVIADIANWIHQN